MAKKTVKKSHKKAASKPAIKAPIIERMPDEKAFEMMKDAKIPVAHYAVIKSEKDIQNNIKKIGFPCVMKVSGTRIIHRTEFGGVVKNIASIEQAAEVFKKLMKIKNAEKVIMQKQLSGIELIIGAKQDTQFGHVITVGLGGIYVEIMKDVTFRICPITKVDAEQMVRELKSYDILAGARGDKVNLQKIYEILTKVSNFVVTRKIKEMDINPLFCNEADCLAADVRIIK